MKEWFENDLGDLVQFSKVAYFHRYKDRGDDRVFAHFDKDHKISAMRKDKTADQVLALIRTELNLDTATVSRTH